MYSSVTLAITSLKQFFLFRKTAKWAYNNDFCHSGWLGYVTDIDQEFIM